MFMVGHQYLQSIVHRKFRLIKMNESISIKVLDSSSKEALNEFVYKNPNTSIFQTPDMAEVYRRDKKSTPLVLAAVDEDTGEIVASLLARIKEEKRDFLSSFSRHSTIRGGPIFDKEGIAAVSLLLQHYNKITENDVLYSRIYPLNDITQIIPSIKENGYEYGNWENYLINLNRSVNEIWREIHKPRRKNINRATKKGVKIEEITEKDLIPIFYDLLVETYTIRKIRLEDINFFEGIFDVLVPPKMAKFFLAKYEGEYIATRLVLTYKGVIYDWHAGSDMKFLSLYPNDLIVWYILKWGSENGFHTFDFGGAGEPNNTSGWAEFKRRFGGNLVNYGRYTKIHQPKKLWFSEKMFKAYRKLILR